MSKFIWKNAGDKSIPHIFVPKEITGIQANIIILLPSNFPTQSSNDGVAYHNLNKIKNATEYNEIIYGGFDSSILSYAYAAEELGIGLKIKTAKTTPEKYLNDLKKYNFEISFDAPTINDFARIYDRNKKFSNFVSMFGSYDAYNFHANDSFQTVKELVKQYGNGELKILVSPTSSGALTGLAHKVKQEYPYSKTLYIESSKSPYLYSGKKGQHDLFGFSYGLIPLIHNLYVTDYVTVVDEKDVIDLFAIFQNNINDLVNLFGKEWAVMQNFVGKFSLATIASLIASINIAKQLYLADNDNIVIVAEDLGLAFNNFANSSRNKKDIENSIIKNMLEPEYKLTLDVTGQRHRERLFKKKMDYWLMRGVSMETLNDMHEESFWNSLI